MNLLSIFTREEPVAGLEISDTYLRLALLEIRKGAQGARTDVLCLAEEPVPAGVISGGTLKNQKEFLKSLQALLKKSPVKVRYVIFSLPADNAYARVFTFPKTVRGERLEETMKLTVGFQLPVHPESVYLDWEKIEGGDQNEILLAALQKEIVNRYADALGAAGLRPIAAEVHPLSLARVIDATPDETLLVTEHGRTSIGLFLIRNRVLRLMRILPELLATKETLQREIKRISDFYEAEAGTVAHPRSLEEAAIIPPFGDRPEMKKAGGRWLISVGAALRGTLPRAEDTLVSLLPVGTEEAYEYQKAITFSEFISSVTIGLSAFFVAVFVGAWIFMTTFQERTIGQVEGLSAASPSGDTAELESRARSVNSVIRATGGALQNIPRLSPIFGELRAKVPAGIVVNAFSLTSAYDSLSLAGIAQDRAQLNLFKKMLDESAYFTEVRLPLTSLELRENIPFSITFRLRDPQSLYQYDS